MVRLDRRRPLYTTRRPQPRNSRRTSNRRPSPPACDLTVSIVGRLRLTIRPLRTIPNNHTCNHLNHRPSSNSHRLKFSHSRLRSSSSNNNLLHHLTHHSNSLVLLGIQDISLSFLDIPSRRLLAPILVLRPGTELIPCTDIPSSRHHRKLQSVSPRPAPALHLGPTLLGPLFHQRRARILDITDPHRPSTPPTVITAIGLLREVRRFHSNNLERFRLVWPRIRHRMLPHSSSDLLLLNPSIMCSSNTNPLRDRNNRSSSTLQLSRLNHTINHPRLIFSHNSSRSTPIFLLIISNVPRQPLLPHLSTRALPPLLHNFSRATLQDRPCRPTDRILPCRHPLRTRYPRPVPSLSRHLHRAHRRRGWSPLVQDLRLRLALRHHHLPRRSTSSSSSTSPSRLGVLEPPPLPRLPLPCPHTSSTTPRRQAIPHRPPSQVSIQPLQLSLAPTLRPSILPCTTTVTTLRHRVLPATLLQAPATTKPLRLQRLGLRALLCPASLSIRATCTSRTIRIHT